MTDNSSVKVAVRIRPQISKDLIDLCHVCTTVAHQEPQIWLGKDKAFTFDEVFDMPTNQEDIYIKCVKNLVDGCFEGYNATVLAYGQTGSGKTYTMGTGFDLDFRHVERGIIPRAVEYLFNEITARQKASKENGCSPPEFKVNAQFMELYNEEIIDLLDSSRDADEKGKKSHIKIHEGADGGIYTLGVIAQCVTTAEEAIQCLKLGSLSRTTASTRMNSQSSRSHAIFTLHIKQQRLVKMMPMSEDSCNSNIHEHSGTLNEFETLTAKFHFVDLAGSERLKRTQATGERQKEGISINSGLLALGNVISALGDRSRKSSHVPYRDSKLTRLLQDSLGGNSRTLMIACISPSDRDFMETLNTLKYANRAKNIKNKVIVNLDKTSQTINTLRQEVENLRLELMEYKQGKRIIGDDGIECVNDMYHENTMLQSENNTLKIRIKALQDTVERLTTKNTALLAEKAAGNWILSGSASDIAPVIQEYVREIETLRAKLMESEEVCSYLRKHFNNKPTSRLSTSPTSTVAVTGHYDIRMDSPPSVYELLEEAKEDVRKLKKKKKKIKEANPEKENEGGSEEEKEKDEQNENNDDDDDDDDEVEEDESSSESEAEQVDYSEDLAGLTCEISLKQKLINQLEMSQRRLQNMRQHYEEKLIQLQNKIQETEKERNRVLTNLSKGPESQSDDKARRVREDYEKKLNSLKSDVKTMQAAKKEHAQMMKNQADYERQLKKLKFELADMKRAKVTLVNKMKDETKKHKESEQLRNREIAQLRKERRNRDTHIKTLEAEKKLKEAVLRRKQEEVMALRKRSKNNMSRKAAGQLKFSPYASRLGAFSPKLAKQKWQNLEKKITKLVANKQSVSTIEKDMERWLHEREKLSRCLEKVIKRRDRAHMDMKGQEVIDDLDEDIENLKANIDYIHENLTDCQTSIVQMEETKDDMDAVDIANTLKNMHLEESKYLIEKLLNMAINQSFQAAQKELAVKELETQLKQVIESNTVQEQLLLHVVHQANENILGMIESSAIQDNTESFRSGDSSRSTSPVDSLPSVIKQQTFILDNPRKKKARKVAATTEDLLFSGGTKTSPGAENLNLTFDGHDPLVNFPAKPSEAVISGMIIDNDDYREGYHDISPIESSRSNDCNIFSRFTTSSNSSSIKKGEIKPHIMKSNQQTSSRLVCAHVASGHAKAVLCVECTEDVLFSSSRDRTVKIWDLNTGKEIQQLVGHPGNVVKVRYCEYTRLAFTASMSYIKIWDVRQNPSSCVQTLCSSGISKKGNMASESLSRYNVLPPGESPINDIALNHYGTTLFGASSGSIRMWDLKMFQSIGALNAGFQSVVMCLAVDDMGLDKNLVISGSKDHSVKVFEVMEDSRGVHSPKFTLTPPHYDGIEALAINSDFLFSGSRDMSIKKWDLRKRCLEQSLQQAHNDYIYCLNVIPSGNLFLSGCRSGILNLWSADRCDRLEEINAHAAAINSIASNNTCMFTASNDCTIGMWKLGSGSSAITPDHEENEKVFQ